MTKFLFVLSFFICTAPAFAQSDSAAVYLRKGLDEKNKGRWLVSLQHFEKANQYKKDDPQIVAELTAAYLGLRKYQQAKAGFMQLEKLGVKTDSTYRQLMLLSFNMRQWDDAIKYASLLKNTKKDEQTAYYLGKSFYEKSDLGNAITYLNIASKENPANAEIPYTIARSYADMMNYKQAIPFFHKALELSPNQSRWIYEMSLIYYAIPDDANALKYMLEAGEKGYRKDNEYLQNLATAYVNAGKPAEGISMLQEILKNRPTDMNILNMIAESYYDIKKYDDAITYFDKILEIDKTNAEALYMIGMSFQKKGEKAKGQALCDKAIEMDPSLKSLKQEKQMGF